MKKLFNKSLLLSFILLLTTSFILVGCSSSNSDQQNNASTESTSNPTPLSDDSLPIATITVKNYGTITLELYPELAPNTVANFIDLANSGFYDGLIFHRVIEDFMIQGGDPNGIGTGGPGYTIDGEFSDNGFTQNTLSHTKGIISMARANDPNSAGSQFFIMSADGTYLDGQYAAFGQVTSGQEVVDAIQKVDTNSQDKPLEDVTIENIRVENVDTIPQPTINK